MTKNMKGTRPHAVILDEVKDVPAYGIPASNYFGPVKTRSPEANVVRLNPIRIPEHLAARIGNFGITNNLSQSETVRTLLTAGLDHLEATDE